MQELLFQHYEVIVTIECHGGDLNNTLDYYSKSVIL